MAVAKAKAKTDAEKRLLLAVGSKESLSIREFSIQESVSNLFSVELMVRTQKADIALDSIVGKPASVRIDGGRKHASDGVRYWSGICQSMELVHSIESRDGAPAESTYSLHIVPTAWLMTQRSNYRIFQHKSVPDIVDELLKYWSGWKIEAAWKLDRKVYPKLEYKVQYDESDFDFMARIVAEAGICFTFPDDNKGGSKLTFWDALHENKPRKEHLQFVDNPGESSEKDYIAHVQLYYQVNPGAFVIRDFDFRNPKFALTGQAKKELDPEGKYEIFDYRAGAFLSEVKEGGKATPVADKKGVARYDPTFGQALAERSLAAERADNRTLDFSSNCLDLWPGVVFHMDDHPHSQLDEKAKLLVTSLRLYGTADDAWEVDGEAVLVDSARAYRTPQLSKPEANGVQSATVVGDKGEEIHTDEFGRVKVQFPWWREGKSDADSSCWIRVSQGWAGTGYGLLMIPRVGQEVLVSFLEGDPDQPLITGRVFNPVQPLPYALPQHKTRSTWRSQTSPGGGGYNELMFEDLKGEELVYVQAQKNLRKLVKHDEVITVERDRKRLVKHDAFETTRNDRAEVTAGDRIEITDKNRNVVVGADRKIWVKGKDSTRVEGGVQQLVGANSHLIVKKDVRTRIGADNHSTVQGSRLEKVAKGQSLVVVGDSQHKVGRKHASEVGGELHLSSGQSLVLEAGLELTLKAGPSFVKIDAAGVTIKGPLVYLNTGFAQPDKEKAPKPNEPELAKEVEHKAPSKPKLDDVSAKMLAPGSLRGKGATDKGPKGKDALTDASDKKKDKKLTWIGIELVDEAGKPVAGERYVVELPDGKKRFGVLDEKGKAKVEGIKEGGSCKVSFPRLDQEVWMKA